MRAPMFAIGAFAAALTAPPSSAAAQTSTADANPRALLGIEVTMSGTTRDTLGVLVSSVVSGSPADRAGLQPRERIAEINGMSLRVSREDVGSMDAQELVYRRLTRELEALRPGNAVSMRVYSGARARTVTVRVPVEEVDTRAWRDGDGLLDIIASLRETQARLREMVANETGDVRESLAQAELEIAELQRRLQLAEVERRRRMERVRRSGGDDVEPGDDVREGLRGLRRGERARTARARGRRVVGADSDRRRDRACRWRTSDGRVASRCDGLAPFHRGRAAPPAEVDHRVPRRKALARPQAHRDASA